VSPYLALILFVAWVALVGAAWAWRESHKPAPAPPAEGWGEHHGGDREI
jgi:hypothetical protein